MMHPFEGLVEAPRTVRHGRIKVVLFQVLSLSLLFFRVKAARAEDFTTQAVGEEGGGVTPRPRPERTLPPGVIPTTLAVGEEGGGPPGNVPTTLAVGEEGGGDHTVTTQAVGEEGGDGGTRRPVEPITTLAIGEEGGGLRNLRNACDPRRQVF